ncbi:hypothetical protein QCA50_000932 [Cerrena zonata]|uniref:GPI inositol-deacylase transmembrane domain-containing protein n=1 Tax=Cerrena zonata TaxID=2478898 RepID=A0AAW0GS79_9APHY
MAVVFLIIFVVVPWQVAYLGCWIFQFYITITSEKPIQPSGSPSAIPLMSRMTGQTSSPTEDEYADISPTVSTMPSTEIKHSDVDRENRSNEYLLLLMTWLLPLAAPILAVWVRTLATAGLTTPFDGDHNFLYVAPFVLLLDLGPAASGFLCTRSEHVVISPRWAFLLLAVVSFVFGPRSTYVVFYTASAGFGLMLFVELLPTYWTGRRHR